MTVSCNPKYLYPDTSIDMKEFEGYYTNTVSDYYSSCMKLQAQQNIEKQMRIRDLFPVSKLTFIDKLREEINTWLKDALE